MSVTGSFCSNHRQLGQGFLDLLLRVGVVLQVPGEELLVRGHVAQSVAAEAEDDALLLVRLAAAEGLADGAADGVRGFRGGNDSLGGGEQLGRLETLGLMEGRRADQPQFRPQADQGGHAVIAEAAGMDPRRHETVAEGVHLHQRRQLGGVAVVVAILAAAHAGAGVRLAGDEVDVPAFEFVAEEGEGKAGKVAAPADAAEDHVGKIADELELFLRLQADHRLVQQDVVEHAAQGVAAVFTRQGGLHRLADGDAQAAGTIGIQRQHLPAGGGLFGRAGRHLGDPEVHHRAAVRLLLVADFDHEDLAAGVEHLAGEGQGAAPLPRPRLRDQPMDALLLVVVHLGDRRVGLVAAGRAVALVLEIIRAGVFSARSSSLARTSGEGRQILYTRRISSGISIQRSRLTSWPTSARRRAAAISPDRPAAWSPGPAAAAGPGAGRPGGCTRPGAVLSRPETHAWKSRIFSFAASDRG